MPTNVLMPALSPTMEVGTISKWHIKEGDTVSAGDVIAEIETDKATMEVEASDEGQVGKIVVPEGTENVAVNSVIAVLLDEGESASDIAVTPAPKPAPSPAAKAPEAAKPEAPKPQPAAAPAPAPSSGNGRIFASPLARRLAEQAGLTLASLKGTGPHGRIVKHDVETALQGGAPTKPAEKAAAPAAGAPMSVEAPYEEIKLSSMRKTIAKRLEESKRTIPHFYLTLDIEIDKLLALRKQIKATSEDYNISVNDFIIKACAMALKKMPTANVQFAGDKLLQFKRVDISVAVAIEGGLITPVIRGAESKSLNDISVEMRELAAKARDGKLKPEEFQGGSFSISNLGMYGIKHFDAVINPPQAAILAIGKGEQRPVVKNGALAIANVMTVTLSCDHRAIDGAVGAEFLGFVKGFLEEPLTMLI
jgi:pyruvate dehydrogenase E2 component (dihydrolipoamide acetyltransferase)